MLDDGCLVLGVGCWMEKLKSKINLQEIQRKFCDFLKKKKKSKNEYIN